MIGVAIGSFLLGFCAAVVMVRRAIRWKLTKLGLRDDLTVGEISDVLEGKLRPYS